MTPLQAEVYQAVATGIATSGVAPSYNDLSARLAIGKTSAYGAVTALVKAGYLKREPWTRRGLQLTDTRPPGFEAQARQVQTILAAYDAVRGAQGCDAKVRAEMALDDAYRAFPGGQRAVLELACRGAGA